MNRILRISLLLVVGFAIGRFSHEGSAIAQVADRPPPCQDVNGDGQSNLADAVFLLTWMFGGGAGPECPSGDQPSGLPDTGQGLCYDHSGNEIPCDDDPCLGQDGLYTTGCSSEGRFLDNGDGTVTDTCTSLMWQKNTADVNGDGEISVPLFPEPFATDDNLKWCDAVTYCEDLELAGHDDWRLPNVRELQSIVDYSRSEPAIAPVFGALSWYYWSSTSYVPAPDQAWLVLFADGGLSLPLGSKASLYYVRAVRSGP